MSMEKRRFTRQKTFLGGSVEFNNRNSTVSCIVRNFSPAGAMIACPDVEIIPGEFKLVIAQKATAWPAKIIWRTREAAGLTFMPDRAA